MSKYKNVRCEYAGKKFDSKAERDYYMDLLWLEKIGSIKDLKCQPVFVLQEKPRITYRADFSFIEVTELNTKADPPEIYTVVDVKGAETAVWRLKKKLFEAKFPHIRFKVVKAKDIKRKR